MEYFHMTMMDKEGQILPIYLPSRLHPAETAEGRIDAQYGLARRSILFPDFLAFFRACIRQPQLAARK